MLPGLDDAVKMILDHVRRLDSMERPLQACLGHAAAESIQAELDLPQSDIAGRDGYAVQSQDIRGASPDNPKTLRIIATARAGRPTDRMVKPGAAIRIMTGSLIPKGADCIVMFEDTDESGDKTGPDGNRPSEVKIYTAMPPGGNIWPAGNNVRKSAVLVTEGMMIGPVQISALASIGRTRARVCRRPRVAIIATGDELVNPGGRLTHGKIFSGNSAAVAALVSHYGGAPKVLGIARDRETALLSKIRKAMTTEAIVTIGGVSRGDYDLVRHVLAKIGKVVFPGIRMMPGATAFSVIERLTGDNAQTAIPVFSLAGPPAGCLINFETLVRPALLRMLGFTEVAHPMVEATALDDVRHKRPMDFAMFASLWMRAGRYQVKFNVAEGRSMQAFLAAANALTIVPEGTMVKAGDKIQALPLDWRHDQLFL